MLLLAAISVATFGQLAELRPFDADSLKPLSWAARSSGFDWIRGNPLLHPEWRPLAYLTILVHYQLVGITSIGSYFVVNFILWTLCAASIYGLVFVLTRSLVGASLAALLFLLDLRVIDNHILVITGRQSTLACSLGMLALILGRLEWWQRRAALKGGLIGGLLLASALSKEPGLAFSAALIGFARLDRRSDRRLLVTAAVASVVGYFGLRIVWAGGAVGNYCEEMDFFWEVEQVCFGELDWIARLQQAAYNATAMFLGTLLPGLFARMGEIGVNPPVVALSSIWLTLAVLGWIGAPRRTLPLFALILAGAVVNFALYRSRNQIYGMMGLYTSVGVGLALVVAWARTHRLALLTLVALTPLLLQRTLDGVRTVRAEVRSEVRSMQAKDPCGRLDDPRTYEPTLIFAIKREYGTSDPECEAWRASQATAPAGEAPRAP